MWSEAWQAALARLSSANPLAGKAINMRLVVIHDAPIAVGAEQEGFVLGMIVNIDQQLLVEDVNEGVHGSRSRANAQIARGRGRAGIPRLHGGCV